MVKKKEMIGYVIALLGAAVTGSFALLSGLRQFDFVDDWFVSMMALGLLVSLSGFYLVARAEEERSLIKP